MRLDKQLQSAVLLALLILGLLAFLFRDHIKDAPPPQAPVATAPGGAQGTAVAQAADHLLLGNPSGATADPANRSNYLIVKPYFALSYNNDTGSANWVSWRVTRADFGNAPRSPAFEPDPDLPRGFVRITSDDYTGSGFDRGHLCPHADRDVTREAAWSTFVMTNIIPQAPNLNQGAWNQLERYTRRLATRDRLTLYIIAGPAGQGGTGSRGFSRTIAGGRVWVPAECWKIIVAVPEGAGDDLSRITPATRVIAVIMPNEQSVGRDWANYRTSVAEIERRTGFRFFDRLPADLAEVLRQKVDTEPVAWIDEEDEAFWALAYDAQE